MAARIPHIGIRPASPRPVSTFAPVQPVAPTDPLSTVFGALAQLSPTIERMLEREHGKFQKADEEATRQAVDDAATRNIKSLAEFERANPDFMGANPWRRIYAAQAFGQRAGIQLKNEITSPDFISRHSDPEDPGAYERAVAELVSTRRNGMSLWERQAFDATAEKSREQGIAQSQQEARRRSLLASSESVENAASMYLEAISLAGPAAAAQERDALQMQLTRYHELNGTNASKELLTALDAQIRLRARALASDPDVSGPAEVQARLEEMVLEVAGLDMGSAGKVGDAYSGRIDQLLGLADQVGRQAYLEELNSRQTVRADAARRFEAGVAGIFLKLRRGEMGGEDPWAAVEALQDRVLQEYAPLGVDPEDLAPLSLKAWGNLPGLSDQQLQDIRADILLGRANYMDVMQAARQIGGVEGNQLMSLWSGTRTDKYRTYTAGLDTQVRVAQDALQQELVEQWGASPEEVDRVLMEYGSRWQSDHLANVALSEDIPRVPISAAMIMEEMREGLQWRLGGSTVSAEEYASRVVFSRQKNNPLADLVTAAVTAEQRRLGDVFDPFGSGSQSTQSHMRVFELVRDAVAGADGAQNRMDVVRTALKDFVGGAKKSKGAGDGRPSPEDLATAAAVPGGDIQEATEKRVDEEKGLSLIDGYFRGKLPKVPVYGEKKLPGGYQDLHSYFAEIQRQGSPADPVAAKPLAENRKEAREYAEDLRAEQVHLETEWKALQWAFSNELPEDTQFNVRFAGEFKKASPLRSLSIENGKLVLRGAVEVMGHPAQYGTWDGGPLPYRRKRMVDMHARIIQVVARHGGVKPEYLTEGGIPFPEGVLAVDQRQWHPERAMWVTSMAEWEATGPEQWAEWASLYKETAGQEISPDDFRNLQYRLVANFGSDLPGMILDD